MGHTHDPRNEIITEIVAIPKVQGLGLSSVENSSSNLMEFNSSGSTRLALAFALSPSQKCRNCHRHNRHRLGLRPPRRRRRRPRRSHRHNRHRLGLRPPQACKAWTPWWCKAWWCRLRAPTVQDPHGASDKVSINLHQPSVEIYLSAWWAISLSHIADCLSNFWRHLWHVRSCNFVAGIAALALTHGRRRQVHIPLRDLLGCVRTGWCAKALAVLVADAQGRTSSINFHRALLASGVVRSSLAVHRAVPRAVSCFVSLPATEATIVACRVLPELLFRVTGEVAGRVCACLRQSGRRKPS